jgi:DNA-binding NtrC family response regulator
MPVSPMQDSTWTGDERRNEHARVDRRGVLVVDSDPARLALHLEVLAHEGFAVTGVETGRDAIAQTGDALVVVATSQLTDMTGVQLTEEIGRKRRDLPVVLLGGTDDVDAVVAALRAGAYDFVPAPLDTTVLTLCVRRAAKAAALSQDGARLVDAHKASRGKFIGSSRHMRTLQSLVARVAMSDVTVLVRGETGTGKELVARAIHEGSTRHAMPFVAINCAAMSVSLLESELFGHARGAFTDAKAAREGLFVQASGGTLLLDEVGDMPLEMQTKLLRALQERRVRPIGGRADIGFDTRVICATHHDIEAMVTNGSFREDLYYRLNVVNITIPPLRSRGTDIIELAQHILLRGSERDHRPMVQLSPGVAERLLAYSWPGNVRELENCLERMMALAQNDTVDLADLPEGIRNHRSQHVIDLHDTREIVSLAEIEERYIRHVIKLLGGNKSQAAVVLGIDRRTLHRRLHKYAEVGSPAVDRT